MIRVFSCLQRNPQSGILYFRRSIPPRFRQWFNGKYEYKRSLKTRDKNVALPLAMGFYSQLQAKFNEIGGVPAMSDDNYFYKVEIKEIKQPGGGKVRGVTIDTGDDSKDMEIATQIIQSASTAPLQYSPAKPSPVSDAGIESEKLSVVCRKYREEMIKGGSWKTKTAEEHEATHNLMIQVFRDVEIATITTARARELKEILLKLPPNSSKGIYAGLSVKKIIAMKPEKTISPRTFNNNYIQRYSSLFAWAVKHECCAINPFEGLKMKVSRSAVEERDPFTHDDLQKIFVNKQYEKRDGAHPWKYWLPLLALFSGARVNEIAQLRVIDVFEEDGVYAFDITKKAGSLKNESSNRVIPLHPKLLNAGFLSYVEKMKVAGEERVFPELFKTKKIKPGDKVSRWFNITYMKNCGLRPTDRKISFHSFRHTFINFYKQNDFPEVKVKRLTGHGHDGITYGRYGGKYKIKELFELISQVDPSKI